MFARLGCLISEVRSCTSSAEIRLAVLALTRITLQHACIALAEYLLHYRKRVNTPQPPLPLDALRAPSDGTLVSTLAELLIAAENAGWNGISKAYWDPVSNTRPCTRLCKTNEPTLEAALQAFVQLRNDGGEGHGLPGNFDSEAELDLLEVALERLRSVLPGISDDGSTLSLALPDGGDLRLQLLRAYDGDLICYRKIQRTAAEKCTVRAQRQRSLFDREQVIYETADLLGAPANRILSVMRQHGG